MYEIIDGKDIAPRFLGHLLEDGRVIGLLIEFVPNARPANNGDLKACLATLHRLHGLKVLHADPNLYNFLITEGGKCMMCDFEDCQLDADDERYKAEAEDLPAKLEDNFRSGECDWSSLEVHTQPCGGCRI